MILFGVLKVVNSYLHIGLQTVSFFNINLSFLIALCCLLLQFMPVLSLKSSYGCKEKMTMTVGESKVTLLIFSDFLYTTVKHFAVLLYFSCALNFHK